MLKMAFICDKVMISAKFVWGNVLPDVRVSIQIYAKKKIKF